MTTRSDGAVGQTSATESAPTTPRTQRKVPGGSASTQVIDGAPAGLKAAPAARARRPRQGTAERREEILRAAMHTFGSKGYHNGSLSEVAEQVGITHAGVLHHFGSKDRLLWAVMEFRDIVDVEHLEGQHIPGGLELFGHLAKTARLNEDRRGIVQTYTVLTAESVTDGHPANDWVRQRFTILRGDIAAALQQVVRERAEATGEPADDPELSDAALSRAASAIIGVMDGLQTQWLLDPDAVELADATAFAIEAILAATLAGSSRPHPAGTSLMPPDEA